MKHEKDDFGTRIKGYESAVTSTKLNKNEPVYLRLDGRSFSKFTKHFQRPHDFNFAWAMLNTTKKLMAEFQADIGYTQSDEISLGWFPMAEESSPIFDYKLFKLTSVIASYASVALYQNLCKLGGEYESRAMKMIPHMDCRVFNVPSDIELINTFVWREQDAVKNNIQALAQHNIGHRKIQSVPNIQVLDILLEKGIDFKNLPSWKRNGSWLIKKEVNIETPNGTAIRKKVCRFKSVPSTTSEKLIAYSGDEETTK